VADGRSPLPGESAQQSGYKILQSGKNPEKIAA
jgi:hypothetical protein